MSRRAWDSRLCPVLLKAPYNRIVPRVHLRAANSEAPDRPFCSLFREEDHVEVATSPRRPRAPTGKVHEVAILWPAWPSVCPGLPQPWPVAGWEDQACVLRLLMQGAIRYNHHGNPRGEHPGNSAFYVGTSTVDDCPGTIIQAAQKQLPNPKQPL